ncbi:hypothetical protein, partial [Reinekea sp. G2M2-21]|uniref:hypothetical protein n=1 Tax=Reinekea sp. G2M2-21 TaxID=2788942 RepID=UPI0018AA76F9
MDKLLDAIEGVIAGHENAYSPASDLKTELVRLIQYAINERDGCAVRDYQQPVSLLMAQAVTKLGF